MFFPISVVMFLFSKVQHRWCELVIKHKYTVGYVDVEKFLKDHQVSTIYKHAQFGRYVHCEHFGSDI